MNMQYPWGQQGEPRSYGVDDIENAVATMAKKEQWVANEAKKIDDSAKHGTTHLNSPHKVWRKNPARVAGLSKIFSSQVFKKNKPIAEALSQAPSAQSALYDLSPQLPPKTTEPFLDLFYRTGKDSLPTNPKDVPTLNSVVQEPEPKPQIAEDLPAPQNPDDARNARPKDFQGTLPVNLDQGFEQTYPAPLKNSPSKSFVDQLQNLVMTENSNQVGKEPKRAEVVRVGFLGRMKNRLVGVVTAIDQHFENKARVRDLIERSERKMRTGEVSAADHYSYKAEIKIEREETPKKISLEGVRRGLNSVRENTANRAAKFLETANFNEKNLFAQFEKGAKFLEKNIGLRTRTFANVGLLAAGTISMFAAPAVITATGVTLAIALTSAAVRLGSAGAAYLAMKKVLDKKYEEWEKSGVTKTKLQKTVYEVGAIVAAGGLGQALGYYAEAISVAKEFFETNASDLKYSSSPNNTSIDQAVRPDPVKVLDSAPGDALPTLETKIFEHPVSKNENLWSVLRKTLILQDIEGFKELSPGAQERKIQSIIDQIKVDPKEYGILSGKVDIIRPNEVLKFPGKLLGMK